MIEDRVSNVAQFIDAVRQVAAGGTAMDPAGAADRRLAALTPREREVLELMAEGRSNAVIAARLFVTKKAVSKRTNSIFTRSGCSPTPELRARRR
jgi:DNA-binding NarL/FixJ family response regulator